MGGGVAHTTRKDTERKVGLYKATPVTLADGSTGYLLTDSQGKIINLSGKYQAAPAALTEGDYASLLLDSAGRIIANPNRDFLLEVARGNISGFSGGNKFGENSDVDTGTEDIVSQGGTVNILSSGSQLAVKSSDADDANGGDGARQVKLYYLDSNYVEQSETITLNGTTLVNTVATDILRPYRMIVVSVGSSNENEGNLTLENTGGGTVYLQIDVSDNQTLSTFYTVPAGKTFYLLSWTVSVGQANKETKIRFLATSDDTGSRLAGIFAVKRAVTLTQNEHHQKFDPPLKFDEKVDIKMNATAVANNTDVTASYDFILVDD